MIPNDAVKIVFLFSFNDKKKKKLNNKEKK